MYGFHPWISVHSIVHSPMYRVESQTPSCMRYTAIRQHLKPYSIIARRTTTISHAFAAAIGPCDAYHDKTVREAIVQLGQDPDSDLLCAYCGSLAETWDHVNATVSKRSFSGFGHRLGNLLPCCKPCNSRKGNKSWRDHLQSLSLNNVEISHRETLIDAHVGRNLKRDAIPDELPEYQELLRIKAQVLDLLAQADTLARAIRMKAASKAHRVAVSLSKYFGGSGLRTRCSFT